MAWRLGSERGVGTGGRHVEVRTDDEPELPQVAPQHRGCLPGGGLADLNALCRACPAQLGFTGRLAYDPIVSGDVRVHLVVPKSFNDAQQIADKFKQGIPVILNLQSSETDLSKRLIDFASGLTYALDGGMQRIADKVFLLTPRNVEVSAEERARLVEKGFFNQS